MDVYKYLADCSTHDEIGRVDAPIRDASVPRARIRSRIGMTIGILASAFLLASCSTSPVVVDYQSVDKLENASVGDQYTLTSVGLVYRDSAEHMEACFMEKDTDSASADVRLTDCSGVDAYIMVPDSFDFADEGFQRGTSSITGEEGWDRFADVTLEVHEIENDTFIGELIDLEEPSVNQ